MMRINTHVAQRNKRIDINRLTLLRYFAFNKIKCLVPFRLTAKLFKIRHIYRDIMLLAFPEPPPQSIVIQTDAVMQRMTQNHTAKPAVAYRITLSPIICLFI
jgi:hypothetical protein